LPPPTSGVIVAAIEVDSMGQLIQTGRFLRRWWPVVVAGMLMAVVVAFVSLVWIIQAGAHDRARAIRSSYPGDEVEALVQAVQDEHRPLRDRNRDVWALGQLRDARALPVLRRHYTGGECQHDRFLCQYELKKAIDLCSGKTTAPKWLQKVSDWVFPRART
jgi:hypothetical protein